MALTGNTFRKFVSNYVAEDFETATSRPSFATVVVKGASQVVDPIGLPVISDSAGAFVFYKEASNIATVTASTLPNGSPIGIIVGAKEGFGHNTENVTVTAGGVNMTVMYRDGVVLGDNIDFAITQTTGTVDGAPALSAKQIAFKLQLEKQGVVLKSKAATTTPSYN